MEVSEKKSKASYGKSYCNGLFCRKWDRKNVCPNCNTSVCGQCKGVFNNVTYCIDCYLDLEINIQLDQINKDIENWLQRKFNKKKTKKVVYHDSTING